MHRLARVLCIFQAESSSILHEIRACSSRDLRSEFFYPPSFFSSLTKQFKRRKILFVFRITMRAREEEKEAVVRGGSLCSSAFRALLSLPPRRGGCFSPGVRRVGRGTLIDRRSSVERRRGWSLGGTQGCFSVSSLPIGRAGQDGRRASRKPGHPGFSSTFLAPSFHSRPRTTSQRTRSYPVLVPLHEIYCHDIYIYIYSHPLDSLLLSLLTFSLHYSTRRATDSKLLIRMIKNRISLIGWNVATCSMRATYRIVESFNDARYSPVVLNSRNFSFPNILLSVNM